MEWKELILTSHTSIELVGIFAQQGIAQDDGIFPGLRGVEQPRRGHRGQAELT